MELSEIKSQLLNLPVIELTRFIQELQEVSTGNTPVYNCQKWRRELLNNKQGSCSHCGHTKYVEFGSESGSQRYKCKSCKRSFTEYSGTWMSGIHHKNKIDNYLQLMADEKSLDKIKEALSINKKTAFDWRHKVLSSLCEKDRDNFTGITESDETFFLNSEKGRNVTGRKSRKRGGSSKTRGISGGQVAVIVTQDRKSNLDLTVATMGRLKKIDIENAIGKRINSEQVILCSDAHVSYKGFAIDNKIEHHTLKAIIKQRVKNKVYHIQHVNPTHNRLKKWIDNTFWGVSTKYLQQYLNWYRIKETLKQSTQLARDFSHKTTQGVTALIKFKQIQEEYEKLTINTTLN